jgi:hypothetical protein
MSCGEEEMEVGWLDGDEGVRMKGVYIPAPSSGS